jgi:hypothetical protein
MADLGWKPSSGKPTYQAESAPGDIDRPKTTGGKGIYRQESVILNAAALHRVYIGRRPFSGETDFQALAPISRAACYTSGASRHLNKTARWVKGEIA